LIAPGPGSRTARPFRMRRARDRGRRVEGRGARRRS